MSFVSLLGPDAGVVARRALIVEGMSKIIGPEALVIDLTQNDALTEWVRVLRKMGAGTTEDSRFIQAAHPNSEETCIPGRCLMTSLQLSGKLCG